MAEFTHFVFPILEPAIHPELAGSISQAVANRRVAADMHNYWVKTTGVYYFPGMDTAILPTIPGIYTIRRVIRATSLERAGTSQRSGSFSLGVALRQEST